MMHDSGFSGAFVVQANKGFAMAECATDIELWFAVTIQYSVAPTDDLPGLTFGACDYTQQPTAFPLPGHGLKTVTANEVKTVAGNRVVTFSGQIPQGSRFSVSNDTDTEFTLYVRWSPRKIEGR